MKNNQFRKLFKFKKKNSGFTLFELLTGLVMSIFVTGALGFGLYQVLKITSEESSKVSARNEATRAIEFISDELRRSSGMEIDTSITHINTDDDTTTTNIDESIAPSYSLPTGGTVRLALKIPGISERVIYSVAPPKADSPWKGPLVIYRWGPTFNSSGNYTNENDVSKWKNQALIDQVDNTNQSITCEGNAVSYQGFYACMGSDDDGDGLSNTAQLFFTGGISTATGNDTNYTAETKAVARVKEATVDEKEEAEITPTNVKSLIVDYTCKYEVINSGADRYNDPSTTKNIKNTPWTVEFTFTSGSKSTTWTHEPNRQAQPIDIVAGEDLTIDIAPTNGVDCTSSSTPRSYTIKLTDDNGNAPNYWHTFNGNDKEITDNTNRDDPNVTDNNDGTVIVLKAKGTLPATLSPSGWNYGGDANDPSTQTSLGDFLVAQGYAVENSSGDYEILKLGEDPTYPEKGLAPNQRIFAFEIGQTDNTSSGFDVQDVVLIVTNDQFDDTYTSSSP